MARRPPVTTELVGVFQTLATQHAEAAALMSRVQGDTSLRAELWPTIRRELLSHEQGEIREVYPVLRQYQEARPLADRHDQETPELSSTIYQLDATAIDSAAWGKLFDTLVGLVAAHVDEEEHDIFPEAQDIIGADRARAIEPTFLAAKSRVASGV